MDAAAQRAIDDLTQAILRLQTRVDTLQKGGRGGQLAHSSLEEGQVIEVRDDTGAVRRRWGWINGVVGETTEGGDPVNAPSVPLLTPSLGGLRVTWDGLLAVDEEIPADFDHMAVHVSTSSGFTPSAATFVGNIRRAGEGGMLPVVPLPYVPHYVKLVPVTTGGVQGVPSAEATATPLQTSGIDLQADSVEAVHIKAGAVEADKLEAVLALVTTIIAGIPGAARVEMDQDGLRGYNASNELIFAIDSAGNAVFSGDIVASEITGSRMVVGTAPGPTGVIEGDSLNVLQRVQVGDMRAQLAANGSSNQANFLAASDASNPSTPLTGFAALPTSVLFALDSSANAADGLPSVTGQASATSARLDLWSKRNSTSDPRANLTATATDASGTWTSGAGSQIRAQATADWAGVSATPEASTVGQPAASPGMIYGFRRASTDAPTLSLQSPMSLSGAGASRRSIIHVEGANTTRPYTVLNHAARIHFLQGELVSGSTDTTTDGLVELASTHSILAPRHAPVRTDMVTAPSGSFGTGTGGGVWTAFSNAAWPQRTFRTGWSGRVRITITAAAGNTNTANATIHFGFALSGGSTVTPAVSRAWNARSITMQCCSRVVYLDLVANADYTLVPHFNISSGTVGTTVLIQDTYEHSIVIEPLV